MIMRKTLPTEDVQLVENAKNASSGSAPGDTETILAKYKKKARDLDEKKSKEDLEKKKAALKEK